jgi:hypothetical protein
VDSNYFLSAPYNDLRAGSHATCKFMSFSCEIPQFEN